MELLMGVMQALSDRSARNFAISVQYLNENVFTTLVVHLPERDGRGVDDKGRVVVQSGAQFCDGAARFHGAERGRSRLADRGALVTKTRFDESHYVRPKANGTQSGNGLRATIGVLLGHPAGQTIPGI